MSKHLRKTPSQDPVYLTVKALINDQLERCANSTDNLGDDTIHSLRVSTKKIRASLQLYSPELNQQTLKPLDKKIKKIANELSSARDNHVIYTILQKYIHQYSDLIKQADLLLKQSKRRLPQSDSSPVHKPTTKAFKKILKKWPTDITPPLQEGLSYSYQRAGELAAKAQVTGEDEHYHASRKWVKYHLYQLQQHLPSTTNADRKQIERLDKLAKRLGKLHDLGSVEAFLYQLSQSNIEESLLPDIDTLLQVISEKKQKRKTLINQSFDKLFTHTNAEYYSGLAKQQ